MRVRLNTYPWAFGVPGGGERQLHFYHSAVQRQSKRWPGLDLGFFDMWNPNFQEVDLLHYFSCMPSAADFLIFSKGTLGIPLVVSPNFWPDPVAWRNQGVDGQIKTILWLADKIIVNSFIEEEAMVRLCEFDSSRIQIVPNAVEDVFFEPSDASLFRETFSVHGPFVLNVANVETRKNQLAFLKALKEFPDLQLITIGGIRETWFMDSCLEEGRSQFRVIEQLAPGSEILRSAIAACEFFAMPSLRETPSIASLEAAAAGAKVLTTSLGSTTEYFEDLVIYVDPYDISSMRDGIKEILSKPKNSSLSERIRELYRWDVVIENVVKCYSNVLGEDLRGKYVE